MDAPPGEYSPPGGTDTPAGVPTPAAPRPQQVRLQTNPGEVTIRGTAPSSAGWGMAGALLSEEVQHPLHALGVPYMGIQNLLQGSQGHSALGA